MADAEHYKESHQEILEEARKTRENLDRKDFHLKALLDTSRELSGLTDPKKIMDAFLLMIMGTFSVGQGYILFCDRESKIHWVAERGDIETPETDWETADSLIFRCFDGAENKSLLPMSISKVVDNNIFSGIEFPMTPEKALFFAADTQAMGFIFLGPKISETLFTEDEEELLFTLTASFVIYLKNARAFTTIQNLNKDLEKRNIELEQTITELTEAKQTISVLEKAGDRIKSLIHHEVKRIGQVAPLDFALLFVISIVLSLLFNLTSPNGIPVVPPSWKRPAPDFISVEKTQKALKKNQAVIVDARPVEFYKQEHILSAINMPPSIFDIVYMMKFSNVDPDTEIIIYGRNISRQYDEEVAHRLKMEDHENVSVLKGGIFAWKKKGYQLEK
ncbi:rhodanese-like domain-containing protein [Desulfobacterales bacterium HSG16]|nr:rhodanese-like domain-containing protein [Desulfobacterales bacterium HSG16]